jgi:hypothetical protein
MRQHATMEKTASLARKLSPNDVTRRSGPGMSYFFLVLIYLFIYYTTIVLYDDMTARHDGREGLRPRKCA